MHSAFYKLICKLLVISLLMVPFQAVQAGMIGTDRAATVASAQADRAAVLATISRAEVASQMQSMGLDPKVATDRVMAMTDDEVRTLAGKLDSAPAGAKNSGWAWAAVIIIAIVVWYNWK